MCRAQTFNSSRLAGCKLNPIDRCIAHFVRGITQSEHKRGRALEKFENSFFDIKNEISKKSIMILISHLIPLCGIMGVAPKALDIMSKLLGANTFRYYKLVVECVMCLSLQTLRDMKLNLHLTRAFKGDSTEQAHQICMIIRDQMILKGDSHLFSHILNDDLHALEAFNSWNTHEIQESPNKKAKRQSGEA